MIVDIKIPVAKNTVTSKLVTVSGYKYWFKIGERKIAFIWHKPHFQHPSDKRAESILTEYKSGMRFGGVSTLNAIAIPESNKREFCSAIIDIIVNKNGIDRVLDIIDKAPKLN
jgi:hypothetical protein